MYQDPHNVKYRLINEGKDYSNAKEFDDLFDDSYLFPNLYTVEIVMDKECISLETVTSYSGKNAAIKGREKFLKRYWRYRGAA